MALTPSLLRAIEDHKHLRSRESRCEVDFLAAAREFHANHERQWRAAKVRADNAMQVQEMRRHLWIESEKAGRDVGRNAAGTDWVEKHAGAWRRQRESLCGNELQEVEIRARGGEMEVSPLDAAMEAVGRLDADVFVSQETVARPHFLLEPEPGARRLPFLVFRARHRADLAQISLSRGARLWCVAYGRDAGQALETIRAALA